MSDRVNEPDALESAASDPPGNTGGEESASLDAPEGVEEASAIDPPGNTGGG